MLPLVSFVRVLEDILLTDLSPFRESPILPLRTLLPSDPKLSSYLKDKGLVKAAYY